MQKVGVLQIIVAVLRIFQVVWSSKKKGEKVKGERRKIKSVQQKTRRKPAFNSDKSNKTNNQIHRSHINKNRTYAFTYMRFSLINSLIP